MKRKFNKTLFALFMYACTLTCSCGHKHDDKEQLTEIKSKKECNHKHH